MGQRRYLNRFAFRFFKPPGDFPFFEKFAEEGCAEIDLGPNWARYFAKTNKFPIN